MSRVRAASKHADHKQILHFLNDAFNDYIASRVLFLARLPQQGSILSSTAIEKYFKAILAFNGNESHGHLKAAHWKAVRNFDPKLFAEFDLSFIELNKKCYRLRYTDDIPQDFNLVIASREFLAELDHTALTIQRSFVLKENGAPQTTEFDSLLASHDDRLWAENHVLLGIQKSSFIYQEAQFVYEMRNIDPPGILEATYLVHGYPKVNEFLRPGFVPKDAKGTSYLLAFGQSHLANNQFHI